MQCKTFPKAQILQMKLQKKLKILFVLQNLPGSSKHHSYGTILFKAVTVEPAVGDERHKVNVIEDEKREARI